MRIVESEVHFEVGHNLTLIVNVAYDADEMPPMYYDDLVEDAVAQATGAGIQTGFEDLIKIVPISI